MKNANGPRLNIAKKGRREAFGVTESINVKMKRNRFAGVVVRFLTTLKVGQDEEDGWYAAGSTGRGGKPSLASESWAVHIKTVASAFRSFDI